MNGWIRKENKEKKGNLSKIKWLNLRKTIKIQK